MGLVSSILLWPLAPVRAVVALGEVIERRVDQELHDPASARRELEAIEAAYQAGEISADERARVEQDVVNRMRGRSGDSPRPVHPPASER
jgi:hypothetical protein